MSKQLFNNFCCILKTDCNPSVFVSVLQDPGLPSGPSCGRQACQHDEGDPRCHTRQKALEDLLHFTRYTLKKGRVFSFQRERYHEIAFATCTELIKMLHKFQFFLVLVLKLRDTCCLTTINRDYLMISEGKKK